MLYEIYKSSDPFNFSPGQCPHPKAVYTPLPCGVALWCLEVKKASDIPKILRKRAWVREKSCASPYTDGEIEIED